MSKQITTIPAKNNQSDKKLKVAAYCHQAIISQGVFDAVQNLKGNIKNKEVNIKGICF